MAPVGDLRKAKDALYCGDEVTCPITGMKKDRRGVGEAGGPSR
jgi:hypothetical protein